MKEWVRANLVRVSLTQLLRCLIVVSLLWCATTITEALQLHGYHAIHMFVNSAAVRRMSSYLPVFIVSVFGGAIGTKCRIYMVEMRIAKEPGFHDLDNELQDKILNEYGFHRHLYLLGIIASFVAIVTIGEDLKFMHQLVLGILSSMAGSQFLAQRVEGGIESSPQLSIQLQQLEKIVSNKLHNRTKVRAAGTEAATAEEPQLPETDKERQ